MTVSPILYNMVTRLHLAVSGWLGMTMMTTEPGMVILTPVTLLLTGTGLELRQLIRLLELF